jgi:hypothetical protein
MVNIARKLPAAVEEAKKAAAQAPAVAAESARKDN